MVYKYQKSGKLIYDESFKTIRSEADLSKFSKEEEVIVVRMIHASGMVALTENVLFKRNVVSEARLALNMGAPILCDTKMVSEGITRARLPTKNRVICTLGDAKVPSLAEEIGNTRSAAAVEMWKSEIKGAVVAIGNAPTALFHLLNLINSGEIELPSVIIGCPVGFVGAKESKEALYHKCSIPSIVTSGRIGGSAITVAAINALASEVE